MNTASGQPVYTNTLQLDEDAIKWFASNTMSTIYVRNNTTRQMRKFSVNPDRKNEFKGFAACFYKAIKKGDIVENKIKSSLGSPSASKPKNTAKAEKNTASSSNNSNSNSSNVNAADIKNDEEVKSLTDELMATKARLREEIQKEKEKAEKEKARLREDVALAKENVLVQKKKFAEEIKESRIKANDQIKIAF